MSALTRFFFYPVYVPQNAWSIVGWWERRRPVYNLAVGTAGLLSVTAIMGFRALPPHGVWIGPPPVLAILAYATLANVCYSLGSLTDLWIRRRWGNDYAAIGPTLFRYGFVFSVGLSLLPIPVAVLGWVVRVLQALA